MQLAGSARLPLSGGMSDDQKITTRLVLNFPGFEKTDSEAQLGRLLYSANGSGKAWGFVSERTRTEQEAASHYTVADFQTKGDGWQTETRLVQFRWNDIVHGYEFAPFPSGFLTSLGKFLRFFTDGTVNRYRQASWRYFGFTIYPFLACLIFSFLAGGFFHFVLSHAGLAGWALWAVLLPLVLFATLMFCRWPGERLYIPMTIADWGFARDMIDRVNPEIEARFEEFGKETARAIGRSQHDEIIIVGHSFGAVWAAEALARALRDNPELLAGKQLTFLALGSSIAKIALAPDAQWMRDSVAVAAGQKNLFWHEIQTKDDFIAFYKAEPFKILGLNRPAEFRLQRIRFSEGIGKKRYRAIRKSMYRTHRQYILHYDKRVLFDTMLRLFGPISARSLAVLSKPGETGL
jgi:hypothetical protein